MSASPLPSPPSPRVGNRSSRKSRASATPSPPSRASPSPTDCSQDFGLAPLTEDEMHFCWRSLVDDGKLSVEKVRHSMELVCGYKLSAVQAKDLLNYMDADGDGRVGREDFRNFMSVPSLSHTDPENFMWTPKAKYREAHPQIAASRDCEADGKNTLGHSQNLAGKKPHEQGGPNGPRASMAMFADLELLISEETRGGATGDGGAGSGTAEENKGKPRMARKRSLYIDHSHAPRGTITDHGAAAKAAIASRKRHTKAVAKPDLAVLPEVKEHEKSATPHVDAKADTKTLAKIAAALHKYEQESWKKFVDFERDFQRHLFSQFSSDSTYLSMHDYHRMLQRWFPMASWCAPGQLRAGDSLATLEYALRREHEAKRGPNAAADGASPTPPPLPFKGGTDAKTGVSPPPENRDSRTKTPMRESSLHRKTDRVVQMSYGLWLDTIAGKYQSVEHVSAPVKSGTTWF